MGLKHSQHFGNSAEYLVCHELQRRGIPVWQLGGNNKRWDLIFQVGDDEFLPAQVKARTQSTLTFKSEDLKISKGYYFVWYAPGLSAHANSARLTRQLQKLTGNDSGASLLVYSSSDVSQMLLRAARRLSNEGRSSLMTNLTESDIRAGIEGEKRFFEKYGQSDLSP